MIHFFYENTEEKIQENLKIWIEKIIISEEKKVREQLPYFFLIGLAGDRFVYPSDLFVAQIIWFCF